MKEAFENSQIENALHAQFPMEASAEETMYTEYCKGHAHPRGIPCSVKAIDWRKAFVFDLQGALTFSFYLISPVLRNVFSTSWGFYAAKLRGAQ